MTETTQKSPSAWEISMIVEREMRQRIQQMPSGTPFFLQVLLAQISRDRNLPRIESNLVYEAACVLRDLHKNEVITREGKKTRKNPWIKCK